MTEKVKYMIIITNNLTTKEFSVHSVREQNVEYFTSFLDRPYLIAAITTNNKAKRLRKAFYNVFNSNGFVANRIPVVANPQ